MPHITEAPILQISRFYTGLYTFRNPLIVPIRQFGRRLIELYDAISGGSNMEITNLLTLKRRPGYISFNSNPVSGTPLAFYSFKPSSFPGQVFPVVDTTTAVQYVPSGSTAPTTIFTKSVASQTNFQGIGAYLYMGNPNFSQKWDGPQGTQGLTNWGIGVSSVNNSIGPTACTLGTDVSAPFGHAWTNPNNVTSPTNFATTTFSTGSVNGLSDYDYCTGFNFSEPSTNQITGFQVSIDALVSSVPAQSSLSFYLLKGGNIVFASGRSLNNVLTTSVKTFTTGGPTDQWGALWTANDVNQSNFGVAILVSMQNGSNITFSIRNVKLTVFGLGGPNVSTIGSGSFTAQNGYQYELCYGNSVSNHVSSPTPPSNNTGPFANVGSAQVSLTASTDPQVNQIRVFRTTDGGGLPLYELPTSPYPNITQTISDSAADNTLQITNICPLPHFNDPPPAGLVDPVWYAGRLWGHVGNILYYSSGPDITLGNPQESWFPAYQFVMPTQIIRKFPLPNGMVIVGLDDSFIVRGIDTTSFTVNEFMRDLNMRNYNAADIDGSNIYLYTSDRQLLLLNANGLSSAGSNISDQIATVDPSAAYVCVYRYTSRETNLFLGDGSTNIWQLNLNSNAWGTVQTPAAGAQALGTIEIQPGVWKFLRGKPGAGLTVAQRDLTTFADEGVNYACSAIFGPLEVADMLSLAQMRDICLRTMPTASTPQVLVLANEFIAQGAKQYQQLRIQSPEPPELSDNPSVSFIANRYSWKESPWPEFVNFFFMDLVWPSAATADELLGWAIGGTQTTGGSALQPGQLPQLQGR